MRSLPPGLEPARLPMVLASSWSQLWQEPHPRLRLHYLVDTAELVVRWLVSICLADHLRAGEGQLPEALADALRPHIERPTLGQWLEMLRAISQLEPPADALAPAAFTCYRSAVLAPLAGPPGVRGDALVLTSILELRQRLVHGAFMTAELCGALLEHHLPRGVALVRAVLEVMEGLEVVGGHEGGLFRLMGTRPEPIDGVPPDASSGPWLRRGDRYAPLRPLHLFQPIQALNADARLEVRSSTPVLLAYRRLERSFVSYIPLGRDEISSISLEVAPFRTLFHLDRGARDDGSAPRGEHWRTFLQEARVFGPHFIGRRLELDRVRGWLRARDPWAEEGPRLGWIEGEPGIGKSALMSRLVQAAADGAGPAQRVFYFRFKEGDARNNRLTFLRLLRDCLEQWEYLEGVAPPPAEAGTEAALLLRIEALIERMGDLASPVSGNAPRLLVFLDGLDEVLPHERSMPALILSLLKPGTLWIVTSRPAPALRQAFRRDDCEPLFGPDGLHTMTDDDLTAMLIKGLESARYPLLRRDRDDAPGRGNPFIDRVLERARGLPIYVDLLLRDLADGRLTIFDEERLPDSLSSYYRAVIDRSGLSVAGADFTLLLGVLAIAREPLDVDALAAFIARSPAPERRYAQRAERALLKEPALVRTERTPEGTEGYTLFHQSFREHVAGSPGQAPAAALQEMLEDARRLFLEWADAWDRLPTGNLRNHLFRAATEYAVDWPGQRGRAGAVARLARFDYLMARLRALPTAEVYRLLRELKLLEVLEEGAGSPADRERLGPWSRFLREHQHYLRRGDDDWTPDRILLQIACEAPDGSPVRAAAEAWLAEGRCDWLWLRRTNVSSAAVDYEVLTLEGHTDWVRGAVQLPDGRVLSWSQDGTIRLWSPEDGCELHRIAFDQEVGQVVVHGTDRLVVGLQRHLVCWDLLREAPAWTDYAMPFTWKTLERLDDQRIVLHDHEAVEVRRIETGEVEHRLEGHTGRVDGAVPLDRDRLLVWTEKGEVRVWCTRTGACLGVLETGERTCEAVYLGGDCVATYAPEGSLRLWDLERLTPTRRLLGHRDNIRQIVALRDGRLLTVSDDCTLRIWAPGTGQCLAVMGGHTIPAWKAIELPDGRLLSLIGGEACLWSAQGESLGIRSAHQGSTGGACLLSDGRFLFWGHRDHALRLEPWRDRRTPATGRWRSEIEGLMRIDDHRFLGWRGGYRPDVLWIGARGSGQELVRLEGHREGINGVLRIGRDQVLSWSKDHDLRLWSLRDGRCLAVMSGHRVAVTGARLIHPGLVASWDELYAVALWRVQDGARLAFMPGHKMNIQGVIVHPDGAVLTWAQDGAIGVWRLDGEPLGVLEWLKDGVEGLTLLSNGDIAAWPGIEGEVHIWSAETLEKRMILQGQKYTMRVVHELPGSLLLTLSVDGSLWLWDLASGSRLGILEEELAGMMPVSRNRLLVWGRSDRVQLRSARTGSLLVDAEPGVRWPDGAVELRDGRFMFWNGLPEVFVWDGRADSPAQSLSPHESRHLCALLPDEDRASAALFAHIDSAGSGQPYGVGLNLTDQWDGALLPWHGPSVEWKVRMLEADGRLLCTSGPELAALQLMEGGVPVHLDRARARLALPPAGPKPL